MTGTIVDFFGTEPSINKLKEKRKTETLQSLKNQNEVLRQKALNPSCSTVEDKQYPDEDDYLNYDCDPDDYVGHYIIPEMQENVKKINSLESGAEEVSLDDAELPKRNAIYREVSSLTHETPTRVEDLTQIKEGVVVPLEDFAGITTDLAEEVESYIQKRTSQYTREEIAVSR